VRLLANIWEVLAHEIVAVPDRRNGVTPVVKEGHPVLHFVVVLATSIPEGTNTSDILTHSPCG
jgi:hypothetical protein